MSGAVKGLRVGTPVEAHTQQAKVVTGVLLCIAQNIKPFLTAQAPVFQHRKKVAKIKSILVAPDTCTPETGLK